LCILNNADFNVVDVSPEDELIDILNSCQCSNLGYYSGFKTSKGFGVITSYHKLVT